MHSTSPSQRVSQNGSTLFSRSFNGRPSRRGPEGPRRGRARGRTDLSIGPGGDGETRPEGGPPGYPGRAGPTREAVARFRRQGDEDGTQQAPAPEGARRRPVKARRYPQGRERPCEEGRLGHRGPIPEGVPERARASLRGVSRTAGPPSPARASSLHVLSGSRGRGRRGGWNGLPKRNRRAVGRTSGPL